MHPPTEMIKVKSKSIKTTISYPKLISLRREEFDFAGIQGNMLNM